MGNIGKQAKNEQTTKGLQCAYSLFASAYLGHLVSFDL